MKKRMICILLSISLLLALAACASKEEAAQPESGEESSAPAVPAEASEKPATADAELIESVSNTGASATDQQISELTADINEIVYPIEGDITLSYWRAFSSMMFGDIIQGWEDLPTLHIIEEETGISIDFIQPSEASQSEQFNLMIASGEYPDLFALDSYNGGVQLAYEEDICIDLTDMVEEFAPNYYAHLQVVDDYTRKLVYTEEGLILEVCNLVSEVLNEQGLAIRMDWLESWGMDEPTTVDQLHDYLLAAKSEYDCRYTMFVDGSATLEGFTGAFGVPGFSLEGTDPALMLDGDTVVSSLVADGYRDYLETFIQWYNEGLIYKDFYSESTGPDYINAYVSADDCALTTIRGDKFETMKNSANDPNFSFGGIAAVTLEEGEVYRFMSKSSLLGNGVMSISTCCEYPEEALMFINWFYTDAGYILSNYGEEGVCFNYDDEGQPRYTEFVTNNENGWNMVSVRNIYTNPIFPKYENATTLLYTYPEYELQAFEKWGQGTDECSMPDLSLTTEENAEKSNLVTDLAAYASEQILKWIVGEEQLTDDSWNTYCAQLESMKLSRVVEIYQAAYDRFNNR